MTGCFQYTRSRHCDKFQTIQSSKTSFSSAVDFTVNELNVDEEFYDDYGYLSFVIDANFQNLLDKNQVYVKLPQNSWNYQRTNQLKMMQPEITNQTIFKIPMINSVKVTNNFEDIPAQIDNYSYAYYDSGIEIHKDKSASIQDTEDLLDDSIPVGNPIEENQEPRMQTPIEILQIWLPDFYSLDIAYDLESILDSQNTGDTNVTKTNPRQITYPLYTNFDACHYDLFNQTKSLCQLKLSGSGNYNFNKVSTGKINSLYYVWDTSRQDTFYLPVDNEISTGSITKDRNTQPYQVLATFQVYKDLNNDDHFNLVKNVQFLENQRLDLVNVLDMESQVSYREARVFDNFCQKNLKSLIKLEGLLNLVPKSSLSCRSTFLTKSDSISSNLTYKSTSPYAPKF